MKKTTTHTLWIVFVLIGIIAVSFFAIINCDGGKDKPKEPPTEGGDPPPPKGKVVIYGDTIKPNGLLAIRNERLNAPGTYLSELIFDGLVNKVGIKENGQQEFKWALAESWTEEGTQNRRTVFVDLAYGVLWHDGRDFTAEDVIFSWQALKASNAPIKGWLTSFIDDMQMIEKNKIMVKLKVERSQEVVQELLSSFKIFPKEIILKGGKKLKLPENFNSQAAEDFAWRPVGTGPLKIREFKGSRVHLVANDDYFLGLPQIKGFLFKRIEDYNLLLKSMLDNDIRIIMNVHPESRDRLETGNFKMRRLLSYHFYAVVYNSNRKPFNNLAFRQAVNMATDKVLLAGKMLPGEEVTEYINTSIFPHNFHIVMDAKSSEFATKTPLNPEMSEELLSRSEQTPSFKLLVSSERDGARILEMVKAYAEMMKQVGLKVTINDESLVQYEAVLKQGGYDAAVVQFAGFDHFYDIRSLFADKGKNNLLYNKKNTLTLQNALDQYGRTISYEELTKITRVIHAEVEARVPACFLFTLPSFTYYDERLNSVHLHPEAGFVRFNEWSY
jgi:ABC-type transport system substrate-binding protein